MTLYSPGGLNLADTTAPLILAYDDSGTKDVTFAVSSSGDLTITPDGGDITLAGDVTVGGKNASESYDLFFADTGGNEWAISYTGAGLDWTESGQATARFFLADGGNVFIGDTSNAKMGRGLTINQGANDNEILAFKSSDVTHGMTDEAENDTYGRFGKAQAGAGGLKITGLKDDGSGRIALMLEGFLGEGADATKSTVGVGIIQLDAYIKSGTTITAAGANQNLVAITNGGTTRFIFDAEGSAHADIEWTTYDEHEDLQILEDMETLLAPGQVRRMFGEVVKYDRAFFEREGLLHDVRDVGDGRTRGMLNQTGTLMLHSGAIRSIGGRQMALEDCLRHLVGANESLEGREEALALLEAA